MSAHEFENKEDNFSKLRSESNESRVNGNRDTRIGGEVKGMAGILAGVRSGYEGSSESRRGLIRGRRGGEHREGDNREAPKSRRCGCDGLDRASSSNAQPI